MLDSPVAFFAHALPNLVLFLLFSAPPLAGWWLYYRAPLGRRRFVRSAVIAAPIETVWGLLDPRGPQGGWRFLDETRDAKILGETPLRLSLSRRPRHSQRPFAVLEETCRIDDATWRIARDGDDAHSVAALEPRGDGVRLSAIYEKPVAGLLDYELTRLALARDLDALTDAALGRDAKALPLFRFSGWRLILLGVVSGLVMAVLLLAPAFYLALDKVGLSPEALLAEPEALALVLGLAIPLALLLFLLLLAVTLIHEIGHALALAAFGHRGIVVSLTPFGGGVSLGARDEADAFEAGVVGLAGPALAALAAFAVAADPERLSAPIIGLSGDAPDYAGALLATARAAFILLTLVYNIPNLLPWAGSDGARTLAAIFAPGRARQVAAGLFAALLAMVFGGSEDLLIFGLMFLALDWFNRKRPAPVEAGGPGWRRLAVAASLALVVGLYAQEAALLRQIHVPAAPTAAPDRA